MEDVLLNMLVYLLGMLFCTIVKAAYFFCLFFSTARSTRTLTGFEIIGS